MPQEQLPKRLLACAELIGKTDVLADIGTDHGYLAIYLLSNRKISRAYLTDINEGPLSRARANADAAGFTDLCEFRLTDGAAALAESGATSYAICGMGGELIADIISRAPHLQDGNITLVLQPMSRPEALRSYLFSAGFEIERELHATDTGRHYVCMRARYTAVPRPAPLCELYFGALGGELTPEAVDYLLERRRSLLRAMEGIEKGGGDASREKELVTYLNTLLDK